MMEGEQMEKETFARWMEKLEEENAIQADCAKKQYKMARLSAAASVGVLCIALLCALVVVPRLLTMFAQLEVVMGHLELISAQLAEADLPEMLENVNGLVQSGQSNMTLAAERVTALDIEGMNQAIADLQRVIAPLARLFG